MLVIQGLMMRIFIRGVGLSILPVQGVALINIRFLQKIWFISVTAATINPLITRGKIRKKLIMEYVQVEEMAQ